MDFIREPITATDLKRCHLAGSWVRLMPVAVGATSYILVRVLLFGGTTIKWRKPVKKQKENPAGCAGEGKQSEGNIGEEKRTVSTKFEFCDEITKKNVCRRRIV